ncbi:MAG: hypothetical protein KY428_05095 [Bacteroidetes bacterium]|nr:hypothetical protein [Bacteroidota bacterium]
MTPEEFDSKFRETLDELVAGMAEHEEVEARKFFSMVCFLENLAFFSPVLYGLLQEKQK